MTLKNRRYHGRDEIGLTSRTWSSASRSPTSWPENTVERLTSRAIDESDIQGANDRRVLQVESDELAEFLTGIAERPPASSINACVFLPIVDRTETALVALRRSF
jgi:hypothetical protein